MTYFIIKKDLIDIDDREMFPRVSLSPLQLDNEEDLENSTFEYYSIENKQNK